MDLVKRHLWSSVKPVLCQYHVREVRFLDDVGTAGEKSKSQVTTRVTRRFLLESVPGGWQFAGPGLQSMAGARQPANTGSDALPHGL